MSRTKWLVRRSWVFQLCGVVTRPGTVVDAFNAVGFAYCHVLA